ncbi:MAG: hypothetical protein E7539_02395 [Ruminococcaceae bacterium]|nr:hypothetical protein [Oscillospiraceae bacterium]
MKQWHTELTDRLIHAITNVKSEEECYLLLEDLCTIKEIMDMSQRLEVARLLSEDKNYQEITRATGVSTATISRVNKCLAYGSGGYRLAIDTLKSSEE